MRKSLYHHSAYSNSAIHPWLLKQLSKDTACCVMDKKNLPKQLAEFFSDRHEDEYRFVPRLGRWLYFNGERWCLDDFGHYLDAARRLCREAAERMWNPNVDTPAMARTLLQLASFNPKMTQPIEGETEPCLEGLLGRREAQQ